MTADNKKKISVICNNLPNLTGNLPIILHMFSINEFNSYIISDIQGNNVIEILEYWLSSVNIHPFLSRIAIGYLCIATNSLDAEKSFSKLRDIHD